MTDWLPFASAFALFFATHSIPVRPRIKRRLVKFLGPRGFTGTYSAVSLVMLALLIWVTGQAPYVVLWSEALWHRLVIWMGLLIACVILAVSIGRPNPFSFGGRNNETFDPAASGIIGYLRHPLLSVLALWAVLHLLANGDVAHVMLFGILSIFAIIGHGIVDIRQKRIVGIESWKRLWSQTRKQRRLTRPSRDTTLRICTGVIVYLALLALHPLVIGKPVFW